MDLEHQNEEIFDYPEEIKKMLSFIDEDYDEASGALLSLEPAPSADDEEKILT